MPTVPVMKKWLKAPEALHCTARRWRGPMGGLWAELDAMHHGAGWVLLDGAPPELGVARPLLVKRAAVAAGVEVRAPRRAPRARGMALAAGTALALSHRGRGRRAVDVSKARRAFKGLEITSHHVARGFFLARLGK